MKYTTLIKFFLVAGFCFVLAGFYTYNRTAGFMERAIKVDGVVVGLNKARNSGTASPVVEFTDHTGAQRTLHSSFSSNPPRYFEGEAVTVVYDPDDPKYPVRARIKDTISVWGLSLFLVFFGGAWMLIASLTWYVWSKGGGVYFRSSKPEGPSQLSALERARRALENTPGNQAVIAALEDLARSLVNEHAGPTSEQKASGLTKQQRDAQLDLIRDLLGHDY